MSIHDDVRRWRDPDHWRSLTALSLTAEGQSGPVQLAAGAGDKTLADLKTEGWFQLPRPYGDDAVERLKQGILDLHKARLPPIFVWVYDEAWALFHRLDPVWRVAMGPDYRVLPCFWAWYVPTGAKHSGWPVHRDRTRGPLNVHDDGRPMTLSVWIALSRATPHNGCMYVVPAPYAPDHSSGIKLQDVRALPAEPGEVLGWRQDLFHWGGRSSADAPEPRIALGMELQGWTGLTFDRPLLMPGQVPDLDTRLALIGGNLWRYRGRVKNKLIPPLAKALIALRPELDQSALDKPLPRPKKFEVGRPEGAPRR